MVKILIIGALLFFISPQLTLAQEPSPSISSLKNRFMTDISARNRATATAEAKLRMQRFRDNIKQIQDTRKRMIVEKISNKTSISNERVTNRMLNALNKLSSILEEIERKGQSLKDIGVDTATLEQYIAQARNAISEAQKAIEEQATKEYTSEITSGTGLKNVIGEMVSGFRLDLMEVHKKIIEAKRSVSKSRSELAKLTREGKNATDSAVISP